MSKSQLPYLQILLGFGRTSSGVWVGQEHLLMDIDREPGFPPD